LQQVEQRAAELDATITAIADGLVTNDHTGRVMHANAAANRILRYQPTECELAIPERIPALHVTKPDGTPYTPDETPAIRALHGEASTGTIMVVHRPHRTVWVSVSAAPIRAANRITGAIVTFTDITHQYELQEQMENFIHMVSHDLRTPLTVIKGYASLLDDPTVDNNKQIIRQSAKAIMRGVTRMNTMVEDLHMVTRLEGGQLQLQPRPVVLQEYVPALLTGNMSVLATDRFHFDISADLAPVLADEARLERILINLLTNAQKYAVSGTPIAVRARQTGEEVTVSVMDRGQGIHPDDIPLLFNRFYRAKGERRAEGIGLGLYITRLLVEAHGGRIWVESAIGEGSTFFFTLPTAPASM
ncbi:MAG TPA: ATP-binding protein, partial [Armatimonadota bacterium]|nr:ATP-binding protein [Armatimonadota bacterium]